MGSRISRCASTDSRYGRELLYLMAYNGWIRATTENVSVSRSDAVDTSITIELDLDRITHEAFHNQEGDIWLPLLVLPVPGRGPVSPSREHPADRAPRRARPKSAQEARSIRFQGRRTPLFPARRRPRPLSEADELAKLAEPDPFSSLTVTDASGDLLSIVPSADVRHWISAAMAARDPGGGLRRLGTRRYATVADQPPDGGEAGRPAGAGDHASAGCRPAQPGHDARRRPGWPGTVWPRAR